MIYVPNVADTLKWYVSIGFTETARYEDNGLVNFGIVTFGEAVILVNMHGMRCHQTASLWFNCTQIDALYKRLKTCPIEIVEPINDTFYHARQFAIRDPNGYITRVLTSACGCCGYSPRTLRHRAPLNHFVLDTQANSRFGSARVESQPRRYVLGPVINIQPVSRWSIEAALLYRRFGYDASGSGAVFSAGLEFRARGILLSPEVRYTRWDSPRAGDNSSVHYKRVSSPASSSASQH